MDFPIAIDQEGYHTLINEAEVCLQELVNKLAQAYNELEPQPVSVVHMGSAAEAILFAIERLKEQKTELETYRETLRKELTSTEAK